MRHTETMVPRLVATLTLILLATSCMCETFEYLQIKPARPAMTQVNLGAAETFAVLAATEVTNTGATSVWGFLGVHPGTSVTGSPGFPIPCQSTLPAPTCGIAQHASPLVTGAISAFEDAYAVAAARGIDSYGESSARIIPKVDIGGDTFYPGLYRTTGSLVVDSGTLYLHGNGDADAVFVFQIGESLKMATYTKMILQGGAQAQNVFWQVKEDTMLMVGCSVVGTVMSEKLIAIQTGAAVDGRLFSKAAVTMQGNPITCVTCVPSGSV